MSGRRQTLLVVSLLLLAGAARLLLQVAAMPPYAGLDEVFHVGRVSFVRSEGRDPRADEDSMPAYLQRSLAVRDGALPDFVRAAPTWRERVLDGYRLPPSPPVPEKARRTYLQPNYQSQQASLYYWLAAGVTQLLRIDTPLAELQALRLLSASLALVAVAATAYLGHSVAGAMGIAAAALLFLLPTWQALMVRASNDALAVAALAVGLALSVAGRSRLAVVEGLAWAVALATKLFTWPVLVVLLLLWHRQRAARGRVLVVGALCLAAIAATALDLRSRTGVAVGLAAFHGPEPTAAMAQPIAYGEMLKITIASAIWTSGEHGNALTALAMALYVLPPVLALALLFLRSPTPASPRPALGIAGAAVVAFGLAQLFHASAHIRNAKILGESMPAAGKEGWYWFTLAPLLVALVVAPLTKRGGCGSLSLLVAWCAAWDVLITEGALLRDFAGLTAAATPSLLFRWGPAPILAWDPSSALQGLAVGPGTGWLLGLRLATLVALAAMVPISCRRPTEGRPATDGSPAP